MAGLSAAGLIPESLFVAVDSRIYAFHIPAFFLMSGLLYIGVVRRFAFFAYVRRLLVRLVWPTVLWTYLFLLTKAAAGAMSNAPIGFADVLQSPFQGQAHFWFLWALLLISLALWPLGRLAARNRLTPLALAMAGLIIIAALWVPLAPGVHF